MVPMEISPRLVKVAPYQNTMMELIPKDISIKDQSQSLYLTADKNPSLTSPTAFSNFLVVSPSKVKF